MYLFSLRPTICNKLVVIVIVNIVRLWQTYHPYVQCICKPVSAAPFTEWRPANASELFPILKPATTAREPVAMVLYHALHLARPSVSSDAAADAGSGVAGGDGRGKMLLSRCQTPGSRDVGPRHLAAAAATAAFVRAQNSTK